MKRILSLLMVCALCFSMSITAFAAETTVVVPTATDSSSASVLSTSSYGYASYYGYSGTFTVYISEEASKGQITVGIESPDQTQAVYFKITAPDGTVVWDRSTVDTYGHTGVLPNNAAEIISPTFKPVSVGDYTVTYTCLVPVRFNCWIYSV